MPLRILKASAGSGKTYSLTETYVRYCLDVENKLDFTNILAITFTNKASAEMKDRIIDLFHTLSHQPNQYPGIDQLCSELDLTVNEIQIKCHQILNRILKDFDLFTITTIDSFFTRLYGSMTLDLFGDPPRDITFDTEKALTFAVARLIEEAHHNNELRSVVIDVLEEKIREGNGVGLQDSLKKLGKELFNDEYLELRESSQYIFPEKDIHQALTQAQDLILYNFQKYKDQLEDLLQCGGMDHSDFTRSFTRSIVNRGNPLDLYKLKSFQKITDPEQWFAQKYRDLMMVKVAPIQNKLQTLGQKFFDFVQHQYQHYATYSVVIDNYAAYRVLRFLNEAVQDYLQDQRLIFLSDINLKVHRHLTEDDALIVYEKLGQRISTVMIDEFQDTSQIQWNNLKPLIRNNLSEGNSNLVVGDVKQAIYRFRNGNWEIMELQVPRFQQEWQENGQPLIENLPVNWRSSPEIVSFNNTFFSHLSDNLTNALSNFLSQHFGHLDSDGPVNRRYLEMKSLAEAPRRIFGGMSQQVAEKNKKQNGYVEINYWPYEKETEKEAVEEERMRWLKTTIEKLNTEGYSGADIGILARGKRELTKISEYLTHWSIGESGFRFSSENSLKLDLSDGIQLLIAGLKIKAKVDLEINKMVFYNYLYKMQLGANHGHNWENALPPFDHLNNSLLKSDLFIKHGIEQLSLFFESLIDLVGLTDKKGQWPYLLTFVEEVKKFELQYGPDIPQFLDEWKQRIRKVQIQMSDDEEKIRLFTIHKSKGLEFDIVIIPFGEWDFEISGQQNILWVQDHQDQILRLAGPLPVLYKNDLQYTSFDFALMTEYIRNVIDNINLLYVAMTRPRKRLYIRLQEKVGNKNKYPKEYDKPVTNTLDLFHMANDKLENGSNTIGKTSPKSANHAVSDSIRKEILQEYYLRHSPLTLHLKPSFDGSTNESIGQGLIIHRMLEDIEYRRDLQTAISKAVLAGDIRDKDRRDWFEKLRNIIEFAPVIDYYSENWKVYNEKSIMVVGGGEYRPDRIQENGQKYVVIDYKTGQPNPKHHDQIRNYKSIIMDMVQVPVQSFIYYPLIPELVEVV